MIEMIDIQNLIPHRYPMILIDKVLSVEEDKIRCEVKIRRDSFLCENNRVPSYLGVEYIAQSIAAFGGAQNYEKTRAPQVGFLLGVRGYKSSRSYFNVGEVLTTQVRAKFFEGSLGSFSGDIFIDGKHIVRTDMTTFRPDEKQLKELKEHIYG